jgi:pimeloyl-ACP methyl ester carboxylesterase
MSTAAESEELFFESEGIRLHAVAAGARLAPLIILLHGFPEFWYGWRKQIGPLAAAGYRVVAPDQRGYNLSSKPPEVSDYAVPRLARDVLAIADQLGCERFHIAGHDWGAVIAWMVALQYPQRLHKLAIINVPHPSAMARALQTDPRQWLRSWYMLFFQLPRLPSLPFPRSTSGWARVRCGSAAVPAPLSHRISPGIGQHGRSPEP